MKTTSVVLAAVSLFGFVTQGHPLVIVNNKITEIHAAQTTPAAALHILPRQGFLDQLNSLLGIDSSSSSAPSKTTQSGIQLPPPATVGPPSPSSTSSDDDDDNEESSTSESDSSSTVQPPKQSSSSSASSSIATPPSATSATSSRTSATSSVQPTSSALAAAPSQDSSGGGISSGGIAVAVIMILLVLAVTAWLVFKYHPKSQAWWAAREERRFQERSYRDGIDGKLAEPTDDPRTRRQTMLKSFFAPSTAHLGVGQEIRRKPVNWGEPTPPSPQKELPVIKEYGISPPYSADTEKIAMTDHAAPMGFNAEPLGTIMRYSYIPPPPPVVPAATSQSLVSPLTVAQREPLDKLPPISPMSLKPVNSTRRTQSDRDLPELPPVPVLPGLTHAKRGSDGLFRL